MSSGYGLWQMTPTRQASPVGTFSFDPGAGTLFINDGTGWVPIREVYLHLSPLAVATIAEWLTLLLLEKPSTQRRVHGAYRRKGKLWGWGATFSDVKEVADQLGFIVDSRLWQLPADHPFVDGTTKPGA